MSSFLSLWAARASVLYVDQNGAGPVAPYSTWSTAATNIQDAVDAANSGDTVLVTNGVYATGGQPWFDSGTNRVTLTNAITLQSVNGPAFTLIVGSQVPGVGSALVNAVRCVGMGGGAVLSGFTLTNGEAGAFNYPDGGAVANITSGSCTVSNCVLINNLATNAAGGGAYRVQLFNCQITGNDATYGGGVCACTLVNCTIASNAATLGGAVYGASPFGNSILTNCTIVGNSAYTSGGGVYGCTTYNSLLVGNGNTNTTSGGASYLGVLINCTIAGNFSQTLGAADGSVMANSIIYYNSNGAYADCYQCALTNCCTPVLSPGSVNSSITNPPLFVDPAIGNYQLQRGSPCIDAGTNIYAAGPVDLDGNPRIVSDTVDMGAFEFQVRYANANGTNPTPPFVDWSGAATNIQDAIDAAPPCCLVLVTNGVYQAGGRVAEGALTNRVAVNKPLTVQSVNGAQATVIQGYTVPGTLYGSNAVRCVYLTNGATLNGFTLTNGDTQNYLATISSVDSVGGGVYCDSINAFVLNCVIVSNTAYASCGSRGGTLSNCIVAGNNGGSAIFDALVFNCIVTNNSGYGGLNTCTANGSVIANNTGQNGGGAFVSVLNNCVLSGNVASAYGGGAYASALTNCVLANNQAAWGGGANSSTLVNCLVVSNAAYSQVNEADTASLGGGTWGCPAFNCTIVGNVAKLPNSIYGGLQWQAGGAYAGTLYNCIVYGNSESPPEGDNYFNYYPGTLSYCDTTPLPAGVGNITNDPAFVNPGGVDFHLQDNSPCINSGDNFYTGATNDLGGNPRIVALTVDVGAYEFQSPSSILSYAWAQQYGLSTDGTADYLDLDGTGMNNWQKSVAGLNPTNSASVLLMLPPSTTNSAGVTVTWDSVSNRNYYLQRASNLAAQPAFSSIQSNILGQSPTTSYTDGAATNGGPFFYRVGVQ